MFKGFATQEPAFNVLLPQNYKAMNRGDMFVPQGEINTPIGTAIAATPHMGVMHVHSIPITYSKPKADVRPYNPIGMATPGVSI